MQIKKFRCGYCQDKQIYTSFTRKGLREHLSENHIRNKDLFNSKGIENKKILMKRDKVIREDFN